MQFHPTGFGQILQKSGLYDFNIKKICESGVAHIHILFIMSYFPEGIHINRKWKKIQLIPRRG